MEFLPELNEIVSDPLKNIGGISLTDAIGKLPTDLTESVADYLEQSTCLVATGLTSDPLDHSKGRVVSFGLSSDGVWTWPTY